MAHFDAIQWCESWKASDTLSSFLTLIDQTSVLSTEQFRELAEEFFLSRTAVKYLGRVLLDLISGAIGLSKRSDRAFTDPSTKFACETRLIENGQKKSFMIPYDTAMLAICRFTHELMINHSPRDVKATVPLMAPGLYQDIISQFDVLKQEGSSREIRSLSNCIYSLNLFRFPSLSPNYQYGHSPPSYSCPGKHAQDAIQDRPFSALANKFARYTEDDYVQTRNRDFPGRPIEPISAANSIIPPQRRQPEPHAAPANDWQSQNRYSDDQQNGTQSSYDRQHDTQVRDRSWQRDRPSERPVESYRGEPQREQDRSSQAGRSNARSSDRSYDQRPTDRPSEYGASGHDRAYDSRNSERGDRDRERGDYWSQSRSNENRSIDQRSNDSRANDGRYNDNRLSDNQSVNRPADNRSTIREVQPVRPVDSRYNARDYPDGSRERAREPERDRPAYYSDNTGDRSNSRSSHTSTSRLSVSQSSNQSANQPSSTNPPPASPRSNFKQPCYFGMYMECSKGSGTCTYGHGSYDSLLGEFISAHATKTQLDTDKNDELFTPLRAPSSNRHFDEEMLIPIPAKQITLVNFRSQEMHQFLQQSVLGGDAGILKIRGTELRERPRGNQERWARVWAAGSKRALDTLKAVICHLMDKDFAEIKPEERVTLIASTKAKFNL